MHSSAAQDPGACFDKPLEAAQIARVCLSDIPGLIVLGHNMYSSFGGGSSDVRRTKSHSISSGGISSSPPDAPLTILSTGGESDASDVGNSTSISAHDPLRLTIGVTGLGRTGFEIAELLESQYHIVPELATQTVRDIV